MGEITWRWIEMKSGEQLWVVVVSVCLRIVRLNSNRVYRTFLWSNIIIVGRSLSSFCWHDNDYRTPQLAWCKHLKKETSMFAMTHGVMESREAREAEGLSCPASKCTVDSYTYISQSSGQQIGADGHRLTIDASSSSSRFRSRQPWQHKLSLSVAKWNRKSERKRLACG